MNWFRRAVKRRRKEKITVILTSLVSTSTTVAIKEFFNPAKRKNKFLSSNLYCNQQPLYFYQCSIN